ncbi:hypothetical protein LZ016_10770 [Sphingomonas sp. SM33]|uniref:Uncharacterized protein n=1 Tax=Sphingomonas telluris TaxID=2907998 RepID=A0ABS9VNM5_9SPHN|nr:hypothetical protein [Sphingomonas telluris]MCH8616580.1 hypothetical protein [Sphingomonas telluris]
MIQHVLLALVLQLLVVAVIRSWAAGAFTAAAWVISREITQAEYRWIEHLGNGLRANMPWWGGLDPKVWTRADPWLDWIVPTLAVILAALIGRRFQKRRKSGLRSGDAAP